MSGENKRPAPGEPDPAIDTARRRFLKRLWLAAYVAPVVLAMSIDELPAQFPSPPPPP